MRRNEKQIIYLGKHIFIQYWINGTWNARGDIGLSVHSILPVIRSRNVKEDAHTYKIKGSDRTMEMILWKKGFISFENLWQEHKEKFLNQEEWLT